MMKRSFAVFFCLFAFLCASKTTRANAILELINPPSPYTHNGVYVGPYAITVNGTPTTLVCDDYADHTPAPPTTWTAKISTFANLTQTEFYSQSNSTQKYDAAAWLVQQMYMLPETPTNGNEIMDIHYATWAVFNGASLLSSAPNSTDATNWYNTALAHNYSGGGYNFSNIVIYTPTILGSAQEFMGETPEPASIALFGIALVTIVIMMRRRQPGISGTLA